MYRERPSLISGATVWTRHADGSVNRVLPDGCMDLLWTDGHLVVAGPDVASFVSGERPGDVVTGLRFAPGAAPILLDVPAHVLRDQRVPLGDLWPAAEVRRLEAHVAGAAATGRALEEVAGRRGPLDCDPLIVDVRRRCGAGEPVASIAAAVGLSARQLQRRSRDSFGYGPQLLTRILRFDRALDLARRGVPLAAVAATCGYADQAHLADDVRALAGMTLSALGLGAHAQPPASGANRSTALPSGSSTVA